MVPWFKEVHRSSDFDHCQVSHPCGIIVIIHAFPPDHSRDKLSHLTKAQCTSALLPTPSPLLLHLSGPLMHQSPVPGTTRAAGSLWSYGRSTVGTSIREELSSGRSLEMDGVGGVDPGHSSRQLDAPPLALDLQGEGEGQVVIADPMGGLAGPPTTQWHMKRCSTWLVLRKIPIKTTMDGPSHPPEWLR